MSVTAHGNRDLFKWRIESDFYYSGSCNLYPPSALNLVVWGYVRPRVPSIGPRALKGSRLESRSLAPRGAFQYGGTFLNELRSTRNMNIPTHSQTDAWFPAGREPIPRA